MAEAASVGQEVGELELSNCDFDSLCTLAMEGKVEEIGKLLERALQSCSGCRVVGPGTFCRHPSLQNPAPLVVAAQYGKKKVIQYLCERYGNNLDIDQSATIVSLTTKKKVHCATALWAASTGGHLDIVEYLVAQGADVNKPTLTQSTPLRGASFHGHIRVMEYLLSRGADINTPNCIGQSPLCIAAMRGQLEALQFLVGKGADLEQKTINGYSVVHLAATKGRVDIVKFLLESGISPLFLPAQPFNSDYIPCPLFLAASTGQRRMVEELMAHKDCPLECKSDALLLLGATRCEISPRGLTMTSREMWTKGLTIREEETLNVQYLPPNENYGFRTEMRDISELHTLAGEPNFPRHEAYFQSLMIRERCMGYGDQGLIYFLIRRGLWFVNHNQFREAEQLWFRSMDMEVRVCEIEIGNARFGHSEGLQRDLEKDLSQYACGIWQMVHEDYRPRFEKYVEFGFKELEILQCLKEKSETAPFIDTLSVLAIIIYIFASWVYYDNRENHEERSEDTFASEACNRYGREFVAKHLTTAKDSSLLHVLLSNQPILEEDEKLLDKYPDLTNLINALLQWGADEAINLPDCNGIRPIHLAVDLANQNETEDLRETQELVSPLIAAGVHLDAVNRHGETIHFMCSSDLVKVVLYSSGPLSLYCQAATRIVTEGIPYKDVRLPLHIVDHIELHDRKAVYPPT